MNAMTSKQIKQNKSRQDMQKKKVSEKKQINKEEP